MASLNAENITRPVEQINVSSLPEADAQDAANALEALVEGSGQQADLSYNTLAFAHNIGHIPWLHNLFPGLEELAAKYHIGNFVVVRGTGEKFFESMPIYARIGMHLLFYGRVQMDILKTEWVEKILREQSIKEGKIFDDPASTKSIASFVTTYSIQLDELAEPDPTKYTTFNEFFHRKLKEGARPVQNVGDSSVICSAADCRLTVYPSINSAKKFWVKGREFDVPNLLNVAPDSETANSFAGSSLAIFRLAPADYHRFHSPIDGEVGEMVHVPGQYYTVNPQAVNQTGFDVFTANTRSVLYMKHTRTGLPVAFVAIGALLVGSIVWTNGGQPGATVKRGEELGYFAYGGSTIVALFPPGVIKFDEDLLANSEGESPIETLVKAGYSLGKTPKLPRKQNWVQRAAASLKPRFKSKWRKKAKASVES